MDDHQNRYSNTLEVLGSIGQRPDKSKVRGWEIGASLKKSSLFMVAPDAQPHLPRQH